MRTIVLLLVCLLSFALHAQEQAFVAPDYDDIRQEITNKSSPYYYPLLLKRYKSLDTTLTSQEYTHLYYGYVFQKSYKPYNVPKENQLISNLLEKEPLTKKDLDKIIRLTSKSLKRFPFNLDQLINRSFAYHLKGQEDVSIKLRKQFSDLLEAIRMTGNGLKQETAYHVITVGNEYEFIRAYGLVPHSQIFANMCDYIKLASNTYEIEGLYFNVEQPYRSMVKTAKR